MSARGSLHDRHWAGELRSAVRCAGALLALLLLVDAAAGTLTPARAALWSGLALLLFLVLFPPRVTAGEGWLTVRGPWRSHRVRTDRLVSVRTTGSVGQSLVLRDAWGGRVQLDPRILIANPSLWLRLDTDARVAQTNGSMHEGRAALDHLSARVDRETALAVFKVSGMED
ncbi:hypothetical protein StrepF001_16860 [Streptomyces sp. F001]|nr:hypothetical protein StrepF001_16860 [Streptomyces sp. F001]